MKSTHQRIVIFGGVLLLLAFGQPSGHTTAKTVHANDKTTGELMPWLKKLLPQATRFKNMHIGLPNAGKVEQKVKALGVSLRDHDYHPNFHIGIGKDGRSVGIVFFTLTTDSSDLGVGLDPNLTVLHAQGFSGSYLKVPPSFFAQFKGKTLNTPLLAGKNISPKGVSPAFAKEASGQIKKVQIILDTWKSSMKKPGASSNHSGHSNH